MSRPRASHAAPTSETLKAMRPERDVETTSARVITTPATPTHSVLVPSHSSSGDQLRAQGRRWPPGTEHGGHVPRRQRTRHQHPGREVIAIHERTEWPRAGVERLPSAVDQRRVAGRLLREGHECRNQARECDVPHDPPRHAERAGPSRRPEHHERGHHEPERIRGRPRRHREWPPRRPRQSAPGTEPSANPST